MPDPVYLVETRAEARIPFTRVHDPFRLPRTGPGYLAGSPPDGVTRVDGVPAQAVVRVLLRTEPGHPGDGALVEETVSASDGTWRVERLPLEYQYDVVGRKVGYNDVIVAGVTPATI